MAIGRVFLAVTIITISASCVRAQALPSGRVLPGLFPEQQTIIVRDPAELAPAPLPDGPAPPTVSEWPTSLPPLRLSLDDAIHTALANAKAIRVLGDVAVGASGATIYDVAIKHMEIDRAQGRFDPQLEVNNSFNRTETAAANLVPGDPLRAALSGLRTDQYQLTAGVAKATVTGGTAKFGVAATPTQSKPGVFPLNPQSKSAVELSYIQPLLQGGGMRVNLAPIVLARIETEQSYFQFKDKLQGLVLGVVQGYWALVLARTVVWAADQQVEQLEQAFARAEARFKAKQVSRAVVAQARVALLNYRARQITARANVLQREAALRNILGLPPADNVEIIPTTAPSRDRLEFQWESLLTLAGERRPDIIELKLVLEADEQSLLLARNQAQPKLDAVGLYRWNGLEGEMPIGQDVATRPGQYTDWTLAVNFSVPLGLRAERAGVRQRELLLARDRVNLDQGMHQTAHVLAMTLRNLSQHYDQYAAYTETRTEARVNLEQQLAEYRANRVIFLNVLQAITDWGNAVSAEAQSLLEYNSEVANLERQTGTILEAHGIRLAEERFGALGPLGRLHPGRCYPSALSPQPGEDRYPRSDTPAERAFELRAPTAPRGESPRRDPAPTPPP